MMTSQRGETEFAVPVNSQSSADLEASVERIIADCDGDARAAVRVLVIANMHAMAEVVAIEAEMDKLLANVSRGYSRGEWEWLLERADTPIPYTR
jgi:hypothetical protein